MNNSKVTISPLSLLYLLLLVLAFLFLYQIKDVLLLLFASFVIASALLPTVDWMSQKVPRGLVVAFVYLVGIIILLTLLIPFITVIVSQSQEFIKKFPGYWGQMTQIIYDFELFAASKGFIPDYTDVIANLSKIGQELLGKSIGFTINLFTGIAGAFTLAIIVLFMILDKKELGRGYLNVFPEKYREHARHITENISRKVGGYVRGQLLLMFAVGLLTALGLRIVGMEFALLLGIIAGVMEIIPIVGPIVAAIPAVIVALAQDPIQALWVLIVYLIVQRLENHILTPMILGTFLEMHPLIIIVAILVAASTLGVFGVILSPAIAAALYVLFDELYLKRIKKEKSV